MYSCRPGFPASMYSQSSWEAQVSQAEVYVEHSCTLCQTSGIIWSKTRRRVANLKFHRSSNSLHRVLRLFLPETWCFSKGKLENTRYSLTKRETLGILRKPQKKTPGITFREKCNSMCSFQKIEKHWVCRKLHQETQRSTLRRKENFAYNKTNICRPRVWQKECR